MDMEVGAMTVRIIRKINQMIGQIRSKGVILIALKKEVIIVLDSSVIIDGGIPHNVDNQVLATDKGLSQDHLQEEIGVRTEESQGQNPLILGAGRFKNHFGQNTDYY